MLPEDGTLVPKHVGATCLTLHVTNNAHLVGIINWIYWCKKCTEWTTLKKTFAVGLKVACSLTQDIESRAFCACPALCMWQTSFYSYFTICWARITTTEHTVSYCEISDERKQGRRQRVRAPGEKNFFGPPKQGRTLNRKDWLSAAEWFGLCFTGLICTKYK